MKVRVCAVGRLRKGPEKLLVDDYLQRFDRTGRQLGLGPVEVLEVEDKKGGGMAAEATLLRGIIAGPIVTMDERGDRMTSPQFADLLARFRDDGQGTVSLVIGGADGIEPGLRAEARASVSFGAMVWPHMLVRVMLAEQLYRAASILARSPYHRA